MGRDARDVKSFENAEVGPPLLNSRREIPCFIFFFSSWCGIGVVRARRGEKDGNDGASGGKDCWVRA